MNFQQVRHPIDYIIHRVRTGRLALPDFQRDFVWTPGQVVELLDSISREWPIGSLLLLSGPQPFAYRPIDNGPSTNENGLDLYILDGQQRVTALYHAIADVSKYCYFIDFNELTWDDGDAIKWQSRSKFEKDYPDLGSRARKGIALIKDIWEHPTFFTWLGEIRSERTREDWIRLREDRLSGLQAKVYQIMAIELEQGIELEALARIFETINRTGIALNAFDLLVAKLYPTKFNLREAWEKAQEDFPVIKKLAPSELEILKLISLLIRKNKGKQASKGVRQGDLLKLEAEEIIRHWDEGVAIYADALGLASRYGIYSAELVPSWSMILGLAGCLLHLKPTEYDKWWKRRLMTQYFSQGANTKIVTEFDNLMRPSTIDTLGVEDSDPADLLARSARANGLYTRGLLGLYIATGAIDPVSGEPLIKSDAIALRHVTDKGEIRKLSSEDSIARVIALSNSSAEKLKKGTIISGLAFGEAAAESQGIDSRSWARTPQSTRNLFNDI